jgi:hypothetical protein
LLLVRVGVARQLQEPFKTMVVMVVFRHLVVAVVEHQKQPAVEQAEQVEQEWQLS